MSQYSNMSLLKLTSHSCSDMFESIFWCSSNFSRCSKWAVKQALWLMLSIVSNSFDERSSDLIYSLSEADEEKLSDRFMHDWNLDTPVFNNINKSQMHSPLLGKGCYSMISFTAYLLFWILMNFLLQRVLQRVKTVLKCWQKEPTIYWYINILGDSTNTLQPQCYRTLYLSNVSVNPICVILITHSSMDVGVPWAPFRGKGSLFFLPLESLLNPIEAMHIGPWHLQASEWFF